MRILASAGVASSVSASATPAIAVTAWKKAFRTFVCPRAPGASDVPYRRDTNRYGFAPELVVTGGGRHRTTYNPPYKSARSVSARATDGDHEHVIGSELQADPFGVLFLLLPDEVAIAA